MTTILSKGRTRIALVMVLVLVVGAAVAWASTEVTVTKTDTVYAYTNFYDGTTQVYAYVYDLGTQCYISYYVYDYSVPGYVERGYGYISCDDVSFSGNGVSLDTDTTDLAIVGDGGDLVLDWSPQGDTIYSSDYKRKTVTNDVTTISFSGYSQTDATVEGSFFGDDYVSMGWIQENKGKTISQVR